MVGVYDVDLARGLVSNIAWTGPNAPAYPVFPTTKGLTSRAIAERRTINVGDVANDPDYLTALDSTQSEIIVPVFRDSTCAKVIGTIDVESERQVDAFDSTTEELLERCAGQLAEFWRAVTRNRELWRYLGGGHPLGQAAFLPQFDAVDLAH